MGIVSYLYSGTRVAEILRSLLVVLGIQKAYNILNMKKLNAHPIDDMFKAREFYEANAERTEAVKNMLADEKSKTVFTSLIRMRQYYDTNDIPPYNHFDQYFPKDIITYNDSEVFLDCGAFNGYTSIEFIKKCPQYKKIVAFEPQNDMQPVLQKKLKKYKNITIIPRGCSDSEHTAYLTLQGESSFVEAANTTQHNTTQHNTTQHNTTQHLQYLARL